MLMVTSKKRGHSVLLTLKTKYVGRARVYSGLFWVTVNSDSFELNFKSVWAQVQSSTCEFCPYSEKCLHWPDA